MVTKSVFHHRHIAKFLAQKINTVEKKLASQDNTGLLSVRNAKLIIHSNEVSIITDRNSLRRLIDQGIGEKSSIKGGENVFSEVSKKKAKQNKNKFLGLVQQTFALILRLIPNSNLTLNLS